MSEVKVLSNEEFRRVQLLQLEMVCELERVCKKHGIQFSIFGGTLLGAVRHKGFIPWDDDADITMLREDYEAFKRVAHELNPDICFFQDHTTDPEYRWGYGKLRRTGTTYVRLGQEHLKCKTGFFVDVFPMDDIPMSLPGQIATDVYFCILRKILWSEVGKYSKSEGLLKRLGYKALSKIPHSWVFARYDRFAKKSRTSAPNRVRILAFPAVGKVYMKKANPIRERYGMPKEWFTDLVEYEFEGKMLPGARDYDTVLAYEYGDYMQLPPEDKRISYAPASEYSFGDVDY